MVSNYTRIPITPQTRLVVDNDWAADPDGLVALAHHLLADAGVVSAVTSTALPGHVATKPDAAQAQAQQVLRRLGFTDVPVSRDTVTPFSNLTTLPDGAQLILLESRRDNDLPLTVVCGGPLTNVAAALREDPSLADRMQLVWIGGASYPTGGWEYNLMADLQAAQFVFESTRVRITQVPQPTYRQCAMSVAEFEWEMNNAGEFGNWLYKQFTSPPEFVEIVGVWPMGDSPTVLITSLSTESSTCRIVDTPAFSEDGSYIPLSDGRPLTVYEQVDVRLLFADFFSRLRLHDRDC